MKGRAFRHDQRGNMAVLFAFGFAVSAAIAALAVDAAALYHERRALQAGVDLAAISAASDPLRAPEIAQSVLTEARLLPPGSTDGLVVRAGNYDASIAAIDQRFRPGATPHNAVEVTLHREGRLYFAAGFAEPPVLDATGIAAATPEVSFSLGSRLASLNGGLVNALLSQLLGTSVALNVMDHRALLATEVDALAFLDVLALKLGLTSGTYADVLAMDASAGTVAGALAGLTNGTAQAALNAIANGGAGNTVRLGKLLSLGRLADLSLGSAGTVAGLSLSALDTLTAAASLADGKRQVSVNLGASVPGLAKLKLDLALGEPAQGAGWFSVGPNGTIVRSAQTRLRLTAELLGGPILLGAGVKLPLWLDLAPAEARVVAATCPTPLASRGSAVIAVRPGLAQLALGEINDQAQRDFGAPPPRAAVRMVDILLLKVTGSAFVEVAQTAPINLQFSSAEIAAGAVKTARTSTAVTSLVGSLLSNLDLTISVLGLGLSPPALIEQAVRALLAPLAPVLDVTIDTVLSLLGLGIGEADVKVHGVRCSAAVLVG
ncbi:MAG: hypothetical protein ABS75_16855 [Pelagibacterium sp. SCN 63-23]|nr:MAG: hypothetical protein ABS75_16855 [Pelagibacterium sp. SCN 63-23]